MPFLRNLALVTFSQLLTVFSKKVNLLLLLYSIVLRFRFLHLMKQSYFLKSFPRNLILISKLHLYLLPFLKVHTITISPKIVMKVITGLEFSKEPDPGRITVSVLKNCDPENSYIIAGLFNMCLKGFCFLDCLKLLSATCLLKKRSMAKHYCRFFSHHSINSKTFEKLVKNRIVHHIEKWHYFWF